MDRITGKRIALFLLVIWCGWIALFMYLKLDEAYINPITDKIVFFHNTKNQLWNTIYKYPIIITMVTLIFTIFKDPKH